MTDNPLPHHWKPIIRPSPDHCQTNRSYGQQPSDHHHHILWPLTKIINLITNDHDSGVTMIHTHKYSVQTLAWKLVSEQRWGLPTSSSGNVSTTRQTQAWELSPFGNDRSTPPIRFKFENCPLFHIQLAESWVTNFCFRSSCSLEKDVAKQSIIEVPISLWLSLFFLKILSAEMLAPQDKHRHGSWPPLGTIGPHHQSELNLRTVHYPKFQSGRSSGQLNHIRYKIIWSICSKS